MKKKDLLDILKKVYIKTGYENAALSILYAAEYILQGHNDDDIVLIDELIDDITAYLVAIDAVGFENDDYESIRNYIEYIFNSKVK